MIVTSNEVVNFVSGLIPGPTDFPSYAVGIGTQIGGKILGGIVFEGYNGRSVTGHLAGTDKRWLSRTLLRAAAQYAFVQLGCVRITGLVPASNEEALKLDLRLGFTIEALLKDAAYDGDMFVLRMFARDCRWLRVDHGWKAKSTACA